ncbi:MAG: HIT family protein [Candidatus Omnitrophota bacterium]
MMDRIWAPWRTQYLSKMGKPEKGCLFCRLKRSRSDKKNYVFARREHCYAVLNLYPYNNGHALIVPYRHTGDLRKLSSAETGEMFALLNDVQNDLDRVLHPDGYNVGMNMGKAAGAGVPKHIHMHIVPRWVGDVNFMPSVGSTKVISQSLDDLYRALTEPGEKSGRKRKKG